MKTKFKDVKAGDRFTIPGDKTTYLKQMGETYRQLDMTNWPFKTQQRTLAPDAEVKLSDKQFVHPMNIEAPF